VHDITPMPPDKKDTSKQHWHFRPTDTQIAVIISLVIALFFYAAHLFNLSVPVQGDSRAHIFKIAMYHNAISHGRWPQWETYWYSGFPMDPFYPPGFYLLGATLTFIFGQAVISYKLLLCIALFSNGFVAYYFARKILKFEFIPSIVCLVAYETSASLLICYLIGEGPDLLGWSFGLLFLTIYISRVLEKKIYTLKDFLLPGLLLGITILIHPYPVFFVGMAVVLFHVIWKIYNPGKVIKSQIIYLIKVFVIGGIIGVFYWLPALVIFNYASPVYQSAANTWQGGLPYLLIATLLVSSIVLTIRRRIKDRFTFDFIVVCFLLASILGFGATRYFPFGLGSLLHEDRFALIMAPLFGIMIIGYLINEFSSELNKGKVIIAFVIGAFLVLTAFAAGNFNYLIGYFHIVPIRNQSFDYFYTVALLPTAFNKFLLLIIPVSILLWIAFSFDSNKLVKKGKGFFTITAGILLILVVSLLPYVASISKQWNFSSYVDNYQQPEYGQLLSAVKDGRLIVSQWLGALDKGDSPIVFGWNYNVDSVNGPYNQGDPKFFKYTVHLEWENRWLENQFTRDNLMQEGDAPYIVVNGTTVPTYLSGPGDLHTVTSNSYGTLLKVNEDVAHADAITPILLDVKDPTAVTEFFNILLPNGYKFVFVDANGIDNAIKNQFQYVMVDDASKIPEYTGKTIFLLNNSSQPPYHTEISIGNEPVISLQVPYLTLTDILFYHGDNGDIFAWQDFQNTVNSRLNANEILVLNTIGEELSPYIQNLKYEGVGYGSSPNSSSVVTQPGFTVVKDSYYPYWSSKQGVILSSTQGFMVVYSNNSNILLQYKEPFSYYLAAIITVASLIAAIILLFVLGKLHRRKIDHR
jgi:uncharacterized membrane protein